MPAVIYQRADVVKLIGKQTCEGAKENSKEFYSERALQSRPVRMDMMEERMAVEFFACNPSATTWSSNQ